MSNIFKNNLGLSKKKKIKGRVVSGHNEALCFWKDLVQQGILTYPFEVIHIDSHADLGLGCSSVDYILNELLLFPKEERLNHNLYKDDKDGIKKVRELEIISCLQLHINGFQNLHTALTLKGKIIMIMCWI